MDARSLRGAHSRLLIVGCSTRAAAWSALRAGWSPVAIDLFGDADLAAIAEVVATHLDHTQLRSLLPTLLTTGWLPAGGLENRPELLELLWSAREHIGPGCCGRATDILKLRDPQRLQAIAHSCGWKTVPVWSGYQGSGRFRTPPEPLSSPTHEVPSESTEIWLRKPLHSGGGLGILTREFPGRPSERQLADFATSSPQEHIYLQQFMHGEPAAVILTVQEQRVTCWGWTRQLLGDAAACPQQPFLYAGSVGPLPMSAELAEQWCETGRKLVDGTQFRGILGIDIVCAPDGISLIEVNPRYTASCEVLELAARRSMLADLLSAPDWTAGDDTLSKTMTLGATKALLSRARGPSGGKLIGKRIVYAESGGQWPNLRWPTPLPNLWSVPWVSDIPAVGTEISRGNPVCTVWATGFTEAQVCQKLSRRADRVRRMLTSSSGHVTITASDC